MNATNQTFVEGEEISALHLMNSEIDGVVGLGFGFNEGNKIFPFFLNLLRNNPSFKEMFSFYFNR